MPKVDAVAFAESQTGGKCIMAVIDNSYSSDDNESDDEVVQPVMKKQVSKVVEVSSDSESDVGSGSLEI